jgi:hypothetical protein
VRVVDAVVFTLEIMLLSQSQVQATADALPAARYRAAVR